MRRPLAEDELRGYAVCGLRYEFDTLQAAVRAVQAAPANSHEQHIALESALVHIRNLFEFFYVDNAKDVNVHYFFESHEEGRAWRVSKPKDSRLPSDLADRISAWLSHFSFARKGTNPEWDVVGYTLALMRLLSTFADVLGPSRRVWFDWIDDSQTFDDTSLGFYTTTSRIAAVTIMIPGPEPRSGVDVPRDTFRMPDRDEPNGAAGRRLPGKRSS